MRESREEEWTRTEHFLADLIDAVNRNTFVVAMAAVDVRQVPHLLPPAPVRRPRDRRRATEEQLATIAYIRANQGAAPPHFVDAPPLAESA
jgi:hypothetical protein